MNSNLGQQYNNLLDDIKNIIKGNRMETKEPEDIGSYVKILSDLKSALLEEGDQGNKKAEKQIEELKQEISRQERKEKINGEIYEELVREIKEIKEEIAKKDENSEKVFQADHYEEQTEESKNEEEDEITREIMDSLPEDLRRFISKGIWKSKIKDIGRSANLNREQTDILEKETFLVLSALEPLNDFIENIEKHIGVDKELAKRIATEIGERIFINIEDSLLAMHASIIEEERDNTIKEKDTKSPENKEKNDNIGGIEYQRSAPDVDMKIEEKTEDNADIETNKIKDETDRETLLREIENPTKPKINIDRKRIDPYREPIE